MKVTAIIYMAITYDDSCDNDQVMYLKMNDQTASHDGDDGNDSLMGHAISLYETF